MAAAGGQSRAPEPGVQQRSFHSVGKAMHSSGTVSQTAPGGLGPLASTDILLLLYQPCLHISTVDIRILWYI